MELRDYTEQELQVIANEVGERRGLDFSRMSVERAPVTWEYLDVVSAFLRPTDVVLDVGTGGGERLLSLADRYQRAVGVDPDPDMVRVARENAARHTNVQFLVAPAERLEPLEYAAMRVRLWREIYGCILERVMNFRIFHALQRVTEPICATRARQKVLAWVHFLQLQGVTPK